MKSVFYSEKQAEEEKKIKEVVKDEQYKRSLFFQKLKKDKGFQKYIVEEILDVEIQANKDISGGLAGFISASPEEVKSIIVGKAAALKCSESIKNKIISQF